VPNTAGRGHGHSRRSSLASSRKSSESGRSDSNGFSGGSDEGVNKELGPGAKDWNNFKPHSTPSGGELWQHTRLGRRRGMAHPPRNPEVQKELLEYLESCGIPASIPRRTIKPRATDEQGSAIQMLGNQSLRSPMMNRMSTVASARSEAQSVVAGRRSSSAAQLKSSKGLQPWTLPWTPGVPLPCADSNGSRRGTKNNSSSTLRPAELWAQQCNPQVKDGSKPLPTSFDDLVQQGRELMDQTQHLAVDIESRTVEDVSDLAMYHNSISRKIEKHDAESGCKSTQTMRSFSETMRNIGPKNGDDVAVDDFQDCLSRHFRRANRESVSPQAFNRQSMSRQSMRATQ